MAGWVKRTTRKKLIRFSLYGLLLVVFGSGAYFTNWSKMAHAFFDLQVAADMFPRVFTIAARNTALYTFLAFLLGLVLALTLALMKMSTIGPYRWLANIYIELFRGLPALVTLFFVGYAVPIGLGWRIPGGTLGVGSVGLGIVAAAYMAETIRAGIQAVPRGQMEAARSLGMSWGKAMTYIVLPQAFRIIIPPLTNEFVLLIKDTSLLFVLGSTPTSKELTKFGTDLMTKKFNGTPLVVIALVYLAITLPLTYLVSRIEKRTAVAR
jgi:polar amino acid transport system permease protein